MGESSDAALVSRTLAGDREAFTEIVARYQTLICSLAYSGMGNLGQSEDVAQETFIAAWRHLRHLREPEKLRAWLCGIVRNRIRKSLHREGREPAVAAAALDTEAEAVSREAIPSEHTMSKEEEAILWRSLQNIPETYREPLILFYREHHSVEQVAAALDLSEDAVKQRLSRGRKLLHEEVIGFVEGALRQSAPGPAFSGAVMAALPLSAGSATTAAAVAAGKGTAAAKSGGVVAALTAWAAPLLGILAAVLAQWMIVRAAPTARERRIKIYAFGALWAFVLGWLFVAQPAVRIAAARLQWGEKTFVTVMAAFWGAYAMGLATFSIVLFRRVLAARKQSDTPERMITPKPGLRIVLIASLYLSCLAWIISLAWEAGDRVTAGAVLGAMLILGAWHHLRLRGKGGDTGLRVAIQHLAIVWGIVLVTLNCRLDAWIAAIRDLPLERIHQLLPMSTVHELTAALLVWSAVLLALTREKQSVQPG